MNDAIIPLQTPPRAAICAYCRWCSAGHAETCAAIDCPFHPFRIPTPKREPWLRRHAPTFDEG